MANATPALDRTTTDSPGHDRTAETDWHKAVPLLVLAGLCAYCNSFDKAFVFDDLTWIAGPYDLSRWGPYLRLSLGRPLLALSVLLNYRLGGLNPPIYHAFNLAAHILAGLALFGIVRRTLLLERWQGRPPLNPPPKWGGIKGGASWLAFAVALLWLVHPLQTQAVTYVIQRCESMMGFFYLLCLYCVVRGCTAPRPRWWYAGAAGSAVCSAGFKEVAATIPLVVLLYDWVFLAGGIGEIVKRRWGLYAGLLLVWVLLGPVLYFSSVSGGNAGFGYQRVSPWHYALTECGVILHYLKLSFWPRPLSFTYHGWPIAQSPADVWLSGAVVVGLLLLTAWGLVRRWWLGFLGAWFFLILAPTSSIMPILDVAFEHRMYLPLAAAVVLAVIGGYIVLKGLCDRLTVIRPQFRHALAVAVVGCLAVVLCALTIRRNEDYRSEISLWTDTAAKRPDNFYAHKCLGDALLKAGDPNRALPHYLEGYRLAPEDSVLFKIGQVYIARGEPEKAIRFFTRALEINPNRASACNDRGVALFHQGDTGQALRDLREAVRIGPGVARYHSNLATVLAAAGQSDESAREYRMGLRLDPGLPVRDDHLARQFLLASPPPGAAPRREALFLARTACGATGGRDPQLLDTLALAQAVTGHIDDAVATAHKAIAAAEASGRRDWLPILDERLRRYERILAFRKDLSGIP